MDKKNLVIAALAALLILGSLWGSVGNKNSRVLRRKLAEAEKKIAQVESATSKTHYAVLTKTAELQKTLQGKEAQLDKARKELVVLRKQVKSFEARLAECTTRISKLTAAKGSLNKERLSSSRGAQITALRDALAEKTEQLRRLRVFTREQITELEKKITARERDLRAEKKQVAELRKNAGSREKTLNARLSAAGKEQQKCAALQHQLELSQAENIGLEKLVEDRSQALDQVRQDLKRIQINKDVLLNTISEQKKNMADLREKVQRLEQEAVASGK